MTPQEYLKDIRESRIVDPENEAVVKGFVTAYEACTTVEGAVEFVRELRGLVGTQFMQQMAQEVRRDPALTHRYLRVVNRMLEKLEE